jgi:hypothetical protein
MKRFKEANGEPKHTIVQQGSMRDRLPGETLMATEFP